MKKSQPGATNAGNLETKFEKGEDVLDYFEPRNAKVIMPAKRAAKRPLLKREPAKAAVVRENAGVYGESTKRNETAGSKTKGEFMDVKSGGKKFKGVAKEPDKRRKKS
jgi:hypothetical protein